MDVRAATTSLHPLFAGSGDGSGLRTTQLSEAQARTAHSTLQRGLRSVDFRAKLEALLFYPKLLEAAPFTPVLTAAFLQLADLFRLSDNFVRFQVLKILQAAGHHIGKVPDAQGVVQRIFSVINSNDPIARALTLRCLAPLAGVVADRKEVHHSVLKALRAADEVEVRAAVRAADRISERSATFAATLTEPLAQLVHSLETPEPTKQRLVRLLRHMHHTADLVSTAKGIAEGLLAAPISAALAVASVTALTALCRASLLDADRHVLTLLERVESDARRRPRLACLASLRAMAQDAPDAWTPAALSRLLTTASAASDAAVQRAAALVVEALARSPLSCCSLFLGHGAARQRLVAATVAPETWVAMLSIASLVRIAALGPRQAPGPDADAARRACASAAVNAAATLLSTRAAQLSREQLRKLLSAVRLLLATPGLAAFDLFDAVLAALEASAFKETILTFLSLAAWARPTLLETRHLERLQATVGCESDPRLAERALEVVLATSAVAGSAAASDAVDRFLARPTPDRFARVYQIAQRAGRHGSHWGPSRIFPALAAVASTEHNGLFLSALADVSTAEFALSQLAGADPGEVGEQLARCVELHDMGHTKLAGARSLASPFRLQLAVLSLRRDALTVCSEVLQCVGLAGPAGPELEHGLHYALDGVLGDCLAKFDVFASSFLDADRECTLLMQRQRAFLLLLDCAVRLHLGPDASAPRTQVDMCWFEAEAWEPAATKDTLAEATRIALALLTPSDADPDPDQLFGLVSGIIFDLLAVPLQLPRCLFQHVGETTVQLSASPQPAQGVVKLPFETNLVLAIEGIVRRPPSAWRKLRGVEVTIKVVRTRDTPALLVDEHRRVLSLADSFFSSQFQLALPQDTDPTQIAMSCRIQDAEGHLWDVAAAESFLVELTVAKRREKKKKKRSNEPSGK